MICEKLDRIVTSIPFSIIVVVFLAVNDPLAGDVKFPISVGTGKYPLALNSESSDALTLPTKPGAG